MLEATHTVMYPSVACMFATVSELVWAGHEMQDMRYTEMHQLMKCLLICFHHFDTSVVNIPLDLEFDTYNYLLPLFREYNI